MTPDVDICSQPSAAITSRAQFALSGGLPSCPAKNVQPGEPTTAVAVGVDTNQVSMVKDFSILVRSVTHDCNLAIQVTGGQGFMKRVPAKHFRFLLTQRNFG